MKLEGIHHITGITADVRTNVDFYAGTLGLRLVKKSVNQDDPTVYHLFYADEKGSPGSDITFFEYPGAPRGRAGDGMVHRVVWRVASQQALAFWEERLGRVALEINRTPDSLRFADPEGLDLELVVSDVEDPPLVAKHPDIPAPFALIGFDGVRAYSSDPDPSSAFLREPMSFEEATTGWAAIGSGRQGSYVYDEPPAKPGLNGAGTIHHVAWATSMDEHEAWHLKLKAAGVNVTPVIDRYYFRSIYFREPSGVLFEVATIGPGFTADEPEESLGEALSLPPAFESLRSELERVLTPLPVARTKRDL
ncbi:MAG: VOC family protein [Actinomycetota bacterium]|nr:VOC family protein [Actinomycetota bacterium]